MTLNQARWHQVLQFLVISGVVCGLPCSALAQRVPIADATLGSERSLVSPNQVINGLPSNQINGGARRGANLFHSFREFNIDTGRGVYFTNPVGVSNILTRVTGNSRSEIFGTLGVLGTANLFLLNPNGILFGANARLDLRGGSFVASTASSLIIDNGFAFSATDPQALPLLTVSTPLGLQFGTTPGGIRGQGQLQVNTGQTLALVGGEVALEGGSLRAAGGRIELGSVAAGGLVSITQTNPGWELGYQGVQQFQDIGLTQAASVNASGSGGGSIQVQGRRLTLTDGSVIGTATQGSQSGKDVTIRAVESVEVIGSNLRTGSPTRLDVRTSQGATGNAGNLTIDTDHLRIAEGAQVGSGTFSDGNGGNLTVRAQSIEVIGSDPRTGSSSLLTAQATLGSTGNAGNLTITTHNLRIAEGGRVSASTFGIGKGGDITVQAQSVDVVGSNPDGSPSRLVAQAERGLTGNAGSLMIDTGSLRIAEGAVISTTTGGAGNGGDITVQARLVEVIGSDSQDGSSSFLAAQTIAGSTGNAGNLTINTDSLRIAKGAQVSASTSSAGKGGDITVQARSVEVVGSRSRDGFSSFLTAQANPGSIGNAGNLTITTDSLRIIDGAQVGNGAFGAGNGGNLTVQARAVEVIGSDPRDGSASLLTAQSNLGSTGSAGNLAIITYSLRIADGAVISTSTGGAGISGDITVQAQWVEVTGSDPRDGSPSLLAAQASRGSTGNAGKLTIATGSLRIAGGAQVLANTFGAGNGGDITVWAQLVEVIGSDPRDGSPSLLSAQANPGSIGNAGEIVLTTDRLLLADGGEIVTTSLGRGSAGNITIQANSQITLANNASISSNTNTQQGNITLNTPLLLLRRNSSITTNATGAATGGNITFNGKFIVAVPTENSDISANAFAGSGGRVNITAQSILGIQFRPRLTPLSDITASSTFGAPGVVSINTLNVDPNRGLVQLPADLTDASQLIVQTCPTGDSLAKPPNEFIITGRGGLPPTPREAVQRDAIQVDLVTAESEDQPSVSQREPVQTPPSTPSPHPLLVEAQGLQVAADGTVFLVAAAPQSTIAPWLDRLIHCHKE